VGVFYLPEVEVPQRRHAILFGKFAVHCICTDQDADIVWQVPEHIQPGPDGEISFTKF
jgi:hypothetical protein